MIKVVRQVRRKVRNSSPELKVSVLGILLSLGLSAVSLLAQPKIAVAVVGLATALAVSFLADFEGQTSYAIVVQVLFVTGIGLWTGVGAFFIPSFQRTVDRAVAKAQLRQANPLRLRDSLQMHIDQGKELLSEIGTEGTVTGSTKLAFSFWRDNLRGLINQELPQYVELFDWSLDCPEEYTDAMRAVSTYLQIIGDLVRRIRL